MAFETGTATGRGDLLVKWFNFLQGSGWTADVDYATDGQSPAWGILHRKDSRTGASPIDSDAHEYVNLHCGFAVVGGDSDGDIINMIPMREYSSGEPQDATEVATSTSSYTDIGGTNRHIAVVFPSSPFERYWFFADDFYAHAVVEWASGFFRHFGMGQLNKIGRWLGGEYYYGFRWYQSTTQIDELSGVRHKAGLDSITTDQGEQGGPVLYGRLENGDPFPHLAGRQSPESAWHVMSGEIDSGGGIGPDADGRDRGAISGMGFRSGAHFPLFNLGPSSFNGYRPMFPIYLEAADASVTPDSRVPLGTAPDIRGIHMGNNLLPGDEFQVGSDTWIAFPLVRRVEVRLENNIEDSGLVGLAYKKIT